ncbi:MAG: murG [Parachlamydiales bacterium]|nr:murG [Parachlamydiales bacterium]
MKILIAAGGSGGHLLPAQQLADELQKNGEVLFAGHRLERSPFFDQKRFRFQSVAAAPLRWSPRGLLAFFSAAIRGVFQSLQLIRQFQPDVVVGFGSFHVFPVLCAAVLMRRRLVLFEANCLMGKVNRLFAARATIVASQFPLSREPMNAHLVPLLPWKTPPAPMEKSQARVLLGLDSNRQTVLIFGGSQGSAFLNQMIPAQLPTTAQAIHLAGNDEQAIVTAERYRQAGILAVVKPFESNMELVYSAADWAICRSGAGSVAELIRHKLPALLIPFPFATDDHQRINAEFLAKKIFGATMLNESAANAETISQAIMHLLKESDSMREALLGLCKHCDGRMSLSEQIVKMGQHT